MDVAAVPGYSRAMRARRISGADPTPIGAPPDWSEEENGHCTALFVRRARIDGIDFMQSAWDSDSGESIKTLAGAAVVLGVACHQHPVVHMGVAELPEVFEPVIQARTYHDPKGQRMVRVEMLFAHEGGSRAYANVKVDGTLADAVSTGVTRIETYARDQGWTE